MDDNFIPYGCQDIKNADIEEVSQILKSDWLTQGPTIEKFEQALQAYCKVKYASAVANGTAGLHLLQLALGIKKGDCVWTSSNSFVASANCALYAGASIDFIDISKTIL